MNWYKKAQEVELAKERNDYYDIGHSNGGWIWVFRNGQIEKQPVLNWKDAHINLWDFNENITYRGRFDNDSLTASIINPFEGKRIPNIVIKSLYDAFGSHIRIKEFE